MASPENLVLKLTQLGKDHAMLPVARAETALAYSRLATPPRSPEEVLRELLVDEFSHRSTHIAALTDTQNGSPGLVEVFAGGARVVFGKSGEPYPVEALQLLDLPEWRPDFEWDQIAEITRFTVPLAFRRQKTQVTQAVFHHCCEVAHENGVEQLVAIMPNYMVELVHASGIETRLIGGVKKTDDPAISQLYKTYPLYWNQDPKLYDFPDSRR